MSDPIKVNDLVYMVRDCPCSPSCACKQGHTFMVIRVTEYPGVGMGWYAAGHPSGKELRFEYLKRIPPLKELDDVKRDEKLMEPA